MLIRFAAALLFLVHGPASARSVRLPLASSFSPTAVVSPASMRPALLLPTALTPASAPGKTPLLPTPVEQSAVAPAPLPLAEEATVPQAFVNHSVHDIRSPLATIIGGVHMIRQREAAFTPNAAAAIAQADALGQTMKELIARMLSSRDARTQAPVPVSAVRALAADLKTQVDLMTALLALVEAETAAARPDAVGRYLTLSHNGAAALSRQIEEMLELAQRAGEIVPRPASAQADALLRGSVEMMRLAAEQKGVSLTLAVSEGLPPALADAALTRHVIENLLSNAIKFTPNGGSVTVSVENGAGMSNGALLFSVSDTGPGIRAEDQGKIFQSFVQVGEESKKAEGTGLGLGIARSYTRMQGGDLWVRSEPGRGATFFFTLPAAPN